MADLQTSGRPLPAPLPMHRPINADRSRLTEGELGLLKGRPLQGLAMQDHVVVELIQAAT